MQPINERPLYTAGRSTSRIINQKAIADVIYNSTSGIPKVMLAKELGLSKPAVSKNVADLISMGLVEEMGEGEASRNGGRKPVMLHFNHRYRYIGALDFSLKEPVCAIGDLRHNILRLEKIHIDRDTSAEVKKQAVAQIFTSMLHELSIPAEKLGIIVISHPGIISEGNEVRYTGTRHHAWTGIGLKAYLEDMFQIRVLLENNVRLSAIGEMYVGTNENLQDLIYVSCGIGLGSSVIVNGNLYDGTNRAAGEIGAFLLKDGQRAEDVLAMEGLLSLVAKIHNGVGLGEEKLNFKKLIQLSKSGDKAVNQAICEIGHELGRIIYNCCVMLDIPTVIFGGDYLHLGDMLFDAMEEMVAQSFLPFCPRILKSSLMDAAGICGGFVIGKEKIVAQRLEI